MRTQLWSGLKVSWSGSNPGAPAWGHAVLATGAPGSAGFIFSTLLKVGLQCRVDLKCCVSFERLLHIRTYKYLSLSRSVLIQVITECQVEFPRHGRSLWLICLPYSKGSMWTPSSCFIPLPFISMLQWTFHCTDPRLCAGVHKSPARRPVSFYQSSPPLCQLRFPGFQQGKKAHGYGVHQGWHEKGFSPTKHRYYLNSVHLAHWPALGFFMAERLSMQSSWRPRSHRQPVTQSSGYLLWAIIQLYHKLKCVYILLRGCRQKSPAISPIQICPKWSYFDNWAFWAPSPGPVS